MIDRVYIGNWSNLTYGKLYRVSDDVTRLRTNPFYLLDKSNDHSYTLVDDFGLIIEQPISSFITLSEFRQQQIDKIIHV